MTFDHPHDLRVEYGRRGGLATAAGRTPGERSTFARLGNDARNAALTYEERHSIAYDAGCESGRT